ncbi:hypothetical protein [Xanthomonas arboricola]|uniref:hypothetical protein n=1 Tax=Xanthomonas arboricola TaxID=56448 RepID=UPI0011B01FFC|nr:hypothetical protein [Xanthomonas arboricola]
MAGKITRSPRAPSVDLEAALSRALVIYDKEGGRHSIPGELAAQHLGYSGTNNGAAARMLASLKAFGLLAGDNKGEMAIAKDVEDYKFVPDKHKKRELLIKWLREPKIYAELLDQYRDGLPSEGALKYKLIQLGFLSSAADDCAKSFIASVAFARYFEKEQVDANKEDDLPVEDQNRSENGSATENLKKGFSPQPPVREGVSDSNQGAPQNLHATASVSINTDRIVVRLSGGRKAWIEIPTTLYEKDKEILKRQIDLVITDDME